MKTKNYIRKQSSMVINDRRRFISCAAGAAAMLTLPAVKTLAASGNGGTFNIRDFGATGDGKTLDTAAIQKAIDACAAAGGGQVLVPKGNYVTGTIRMKDKVTLHLSKDAVLLGSTQLADYATDIVGCVEAPAFNRCLIYAHSARNIAFTGSGWIDARGAKTHFPVNVDNGLGERPMLMRLVQCQDVVFADLNFKNSASWGLHLVDCDRVRFNGIRIESKDNNTNNDGIDLDGCQDVEIIKCRINAGDDAICPKSTTKRLCKNIVVRDCVLSSHTAGFKLGTSSRGGFVDIEVTNTHFVDCPMGAIKLLLVDGGRMENVLLSDLQMERVGGPIFARLGNRGRAYDQPTEQIYDENQKPEGVPTGIMRNIQIKNIDATVTGDQRDRQGIMLTGIPGHPIENIALENIRISFPGGGTEQEAKRVVPEDIARYPEQFFFGVLPASGIYARHINGLSLKDITATFEKTDARPPVHLECVGNLTHSGVIFDQKPWEPAQTSNPAP
jgi:polygalacturonase